MRYTSAMKVLLYSRNGDYPENIETLVKNFGLEIVAAPNQMDVVVTYGGDGTLLGAERDFPEVPKLPLKDSGVGYHAIQKPIEQTLKLFVENKLHIFEFFKLEATIDDKKFLALNEITIRNSLPTSALRFTVAAKDLAPVPDSNPLIGDGLIVSTPFGSTGYFYSITHNTFETGIGLAFNNIHNSNPKSEILAESSEIEVKISRGPAQITFDNNPEIPILKDGEIIKIKKSLQTAKIYTLK